MDVELLKKLKKMSKMTNEELSDRAGVPLGTLNKILSGATKSPRHDTVEAIIGALKKFSYNTLEGIDDAVLREALAYGNTGKYTIEDYYALPEDVRVELIDGAFYVMEAPDVIHQAIIGELHYLIKSHIKEHKGNCRVFISPFDVKLDADNKTMVQPDIMVICDNDKIDNKRCNGAPDFIAEIVSKSSSRLDYIKKLNKYMEAGVREYWIIDPAYRTIMAYHFYKEDRPSHYTFNDVIPLGILEGLFIDFNEIENEIKHYQGSKQ